VTHNDRLASKRVCAEGRQEKCGLGNIIDSGEFTVYGLFKHDVFWDCVSEDVHARGYALLVGSRNGRGLAHCFHEFSDVVGPKRRMRHGQVPIRIWCARLNDVAAMGHARHQTLQDL
jgi:hypothetical protein